jgi:hypothetical protein
VRARKLSGTSLRRQNCGLCHYERLNDHTVCGARSERAGRCSLAGLWRPCGWRLDRSVRRGTGSSIPPMLTDCSRGLLRGTGTREIGRDGTAASVLLSGLTAPGMPPPTTTSAQFRSRCATAASPPGSCPRGGGHRGRASLCDQGGTKRRNRIPESSSAAVPLAAIHSGHGQSRADNQEQPRSSLDLRCSPAAGHNPARSGFGSKGSQPRL